MTWQSAALELWAKYGKKATLWLVQQIGGKKVLAAVEQQLNGAVARRRAILKARHTRAGRWGPILVEDRARYVVYSDQTPVEIFPGVKGDIVKLTATYNTDKLRSPEDVPTREFARWVEARWKRLRRNVETDKETPSAVITQAGSEGGRAHFHTMVDALPELLDRLVGAPANTVTGHNGIPERPGVYLFSDKVNPVYVGQTRNLRSRLRQHTSSTARENQAALAWRIALKEAAAAGHPVAGTRRQLEANPIVADHFTAAKSRVAAMDVRFIELDDPVTRTVFEVYAARALGTDEFNSWETH